MIKTHVWFATVIAVTAGCSDPGTEPTEPTNGVFLLTDARAYQLPPAGRPPISILAMISNRTFAGVPVRRCLIGGSPLDPIGADLVLETAQADGTWRAQDVRIACLNSTQPRADVILAPHEVALVARIVKRVPGRFRIRMGYGTTGDTTPTDTVTSPVFTVR